MVDTEDKREWGKGELLFLLNSFIFIFILQICMLRTTLNTLHSFNSPYNSKWILVSYPLDRRELAVTEDFQ